MEQNQTSASRRDRRYRRKKQSEWPHILLFYVLPFLVFNSILFFCLTTKPKLAVVVEDTNDYLSTNVVLTVKSFFPTKSVSMTLDGEPLELEKGKGRTYTATVYKNGSIESSVVNLNGMPATVFEHVNVLDDNPPEFSSTDIQDGIVTITVADSQSGINFDSIYALDSAGERINPLSVDRASNTLSFEMDPAGLHVFARDKADNEVQGTFTSHKEGSVETLEGGAVDPEEEDTAQAAETNMGTDTAATVSVQ
ncbi:hypothetical protein DXB18_09600 [Clostridium sp. OM02-18AC]|uniref:hypothetical protein n=1 Tax=Clostridium sp. OM02-18AC TaxID=2292311 RepID=UPI000E4836A2|nr:hypothetical protein [Clostridium sp. OM02-18AC]RHV65363.1 hypothetical protein DXB18_09600 [Clostridium sp. OM02-18AC]